MGNPVFASDNRLDVDVLTTTPASASSTDFSSKNLFDDRLFTAFKPVASATSMVIETDAGVGNTVDVDYLSIMSHNIDTVTAQDGIYSLENAAVPAGPFSTILSNVPVIDDKIIFNEFTKVTDRVFRLTITTSGGAATFVPSIGQIQWGKRVEPDGFIQVGFDPEAEDIRGRFTRSQNGNILGAISTISGRFADIFIPFLSNAFLRDETTGGFKDFWDNHASKLKPFVFSWNPGNPGIFEKDSFFCVVQPEAGIARPLSTNLDKGFRSLQFSVEGLKE